MLDEELVNKLTGHQMVEEGAGLIARGLFVINEQKGASEASATGLAALQTIRSLWLDFERNTEIS